MAYTVVWLRGETVMGTTSFDGLAFAKSHALEHFPAMQRESGVNQVEVRDDMKALHFHHPSARLS